MYCRRQRPMAGVHWEVWDRYTCPHILLRIDLLVFQPNNIYHLFLFFLTLKNKLQEFNEWESSFVFMALFSAWNIVIFRHTPVVPMSLGGRAEFKVTLVVKGLQNVDCGAQQSFGFQLSFTRATWTDQRGLYLLLPYVSVQRIRAKGEWVSST